MKMGFYICFVFVIGSLSCYGNPRRVIRIGETRGLRKSSALIKRIGDNQNTYRGNKITRIGTTKLVPCGVVAKRSETTSLSILLEMRHNKAFHKDKKSHVQVKRIKNYRHWGNGMLEGKGRPESSLRERHDIAFHKDIVFEEPVVKKKKISVFCRDRDR